MKIRHKVELAFVIVAFIIASYILITTTKEYQFSNATLIILIANSIFQLDMFFTATDENGAPLDKKLDRKIRIFLLILFFIYFAIAYFTNSISFLQ